MKVAVSTAGELASEPWAMLGLFLSRTSARCEEIPSVSAFFVVSENTLVTSSCCSCSVAGAECGHRCFQQDLEANLYPL